MSREERQEIVTDWVRRAFGPVLINPHDKLERSRRVLEEALELYQAAGGKQTDIAPLAERTFSRPVGDLYQERGQLGVTLLAFSDCETDMLERMEVRRLLDRDPHYYTSRMASKVLAMPQFYTESEYVSSQNWLSAHDPSYLKELQK